MKNTIEFLKNNIIAHRGLHNNKDIPENTLLSFQKAMDKKYAIELDIHILKDNDIVVFHDNNLKRMTGMDKKIKDVSYTEIKELKLLDTNNYIPKLSKVLELVNGRVPLIIELKKDTKGYKLEREVIKILDNYKYEYAIQSFNPLSILYFRIKRPYVIRGLLIKKIKLVKLFNFITKPDFISCNYKILSNKWIEKIRKNKTILGWTIHNDIEYRENRKYCDNLICENIDDINI